MMKENEGSAEEDKVLKRQILQLVKQLKYLQNEYCNVHRGLINLKHNNLTTQEYDLLACTHKDLMKRVNDKIQTTLQVSHQKQQILQEISIKVQSLPESQWIQSNHNRLNENSQESFELPQLREQPFSHQISRQIQGKLEGKKNQALRSQGSQYIFSTKVTSQNKKDQTYEDKKRSNIDQPIDISSDTSYGGVQKKFADQKFNDNSDAFNYQVTQNDVLKHLSVLVSQDPSIIKTPQNLEKIYYREYPWLKQKQFFQFSHIYEQLLLQSKKLNYNFDHSVLQASGNLLTKPQTIESLQSPKIYQTSLQTSIFAPPDESTLAEDRLGDLLDELTDQINLFVQSRDLKTKQQHLIEQKIIFYSPILKKLTKNSFVLDLSFMSLDIEEYPKKLKPFQEMLCLFINDFNDISKINIQQIILNGRIDQILKQEKQKFFKLPWQSIKKLNINKKMTYLSSRENRFHGFEQFLPITYEIEMKYFATSLIYIELTMGLLNDDSLNQILSNKYKNLSKVRLKILHMQMSLSFRLRKLKIDKNLQMQIFKIKGKQLLPIFIYDQNQGALHFDSVIQPDQYIITEEKMIKKQQFFDKYCGNKFNYQLADDKQWSWIRFFNPCTIQIFTEFLQHDWQEIVLLDIHYFTLNEQIWSIMKKKALCFSNLKFIKMYIQGIKTISQDQIVKIFPSVKEIYLYHISKKKTNTQELEHLFSLVHDFKELNQELTINTVEVPIFILN